MGDRYLYFGDAMSKIKLKNPDKAEKILSYVWAYM